ncbi:MAG: hypothetical protein RLY86_1234 [Pseudomonadota bacterium]|jgi:exopolysaccharide production protein ExoQ
MHRLYPLAEYLLYAGVVLLAAGGLDMLIRVDAGFTTIRAGMWALVYLGFAVLFVLRPGTLLLALHQGWPLLAWPALALVSWLWSVNKGETLVAGLQLLSVTLFGLYMGARLGMAGLTRLVFLVLLATAGLSIASIGLGEIAWDHHGNLIGAYSHKNLLGNRMALLVLLAAVVAAAAAWRGAALAVLVLSAGLLLLSGSATSLLAAVVCLGVLGLLYCLDLRGQARILGFCLLVLGMVAVLFLAHLAKLDLIVLVLEGLGKDASLTGRATLWDFAVAAIGERPGLGYGYDAFWTGRADQADYLRWVVQQRLSHFHNGFLDVGVQLGITGMALMVAVLGWAVLRALRYRTADPSSYAWTPALVLALIIIANTAEVVVFTRHGFFQLLLAAIWVRMALVLSPVPVHSPTRTPTPRHPRAWQEG